MATSTGQVGDQQLPVPSWGPSHCWHGDQQLPVLSRGPSHCWHRSKRTQGQRQNLESQARQGGCAWGSGILPPVNRCFAK